MQNYVSPSSVVGSEAALSWLRQAVPPASWECGLWKQHRSPLPLVSSTFHMSVTNVDGGQSGHLRGINAKAHRYRSPQAVSFELSDGPFWRDSSI